MPDAKAVAAFIARWKDSGGNELANAQPFLKELCEVLELPRHEAAKAVNEDNAYSFERKVFLHIGGGKTEMKRLDLYKRGCFVLECKQGQDAAPQKSGRTRSNDGRTTSTAVKRDTRPWEDLMALAKVQAEQYVRALPLGEPLPPFLIVVDVGYCFDIYSEFSCTGRTYIPYPDQGTYRIRLNDLKNDKIQERFLALWTEPASLNPALHAARVTTEISGHLANLAKSLEHAGHSPEKVSTFLIRCLFTMFAEDVGLLPAKCFQDILTDAVADPNPKAFPSMAQDLWQLMNTGGYSARLRDELKRFNGNLFTYAEALPLDHEQLGILLAAAKADWREVEPAIFGTLLERALLHLTIRRRPMPSRRWRNSKENPGFTVRGSLLSSVDIPYSWGTTGGNRIKLHPLKTQELPPWRI